MKKFIVLNKNENFAFTLAEVLITLAIIGVVAALTVPSVIVKYQKEQTVTSLKKAYSSLTNAIILSKNDNGNPISWNWDESAGWNNSDAANAWAEKYLYPYLKGHKNIDKKTVFYVQCIDSSGDYCQRQGRYNYPYYMLDGMGLEVMYGGYSWSDDPWMIFRVDINGNKKPNVYGKDIFNFYFLAKKGFTSAYWVSWLASYKSFKRSEVIEHCKTRGGALSTYCADIIMNDGWKIEDDYPW